MIAVRLASVAKRENSTLVPAVWTNWEGVLKEDTNIMYPNVRFNVGATAPTIYNFAYIPDFARYYWIRNWHWQAGTWVAEMEVDVLASFKNIIGQSEQYILRSSNTWDDKVVDTYYPTQGTVTLQTNTVNMATQWNPVYTGGCYIIGIINDADNGRVGAVSYYIFSSDGFKQLMESMLGSADWLGINKEEISENLTKALFNPFQYVVSCLWFPYQLSTSKPFTSIKFGYWTLNCSGWSITAPSRTFPVSGKVTIPKHPQTNSRGEWCNLAPYTRYTLFMGPFGEIPIDSTLLINSQELFISLVVDMISGQGRLMVSIYGNDASAFCVRRAMCATPIQLAQISRDYVEAGIDVLGTIGSIVTGDFFKGAGGIKSTIEAALPQLETRGSNGTALDFWHPPYLQAASTTLVEDDLANTGRPLCRVKKINSIPGYILCYEPDISLPCTSEENKMIKAYMEEGFFYE